MEYRYSYQEERGNFDAYVEDKAGNNVWEVHYPEMYENPEGDMVEASTIFEDGYMKSPTDMSGLEKYLKQMGIIQSEDIVVDDFTEDVEDEDNGESQSISELANDVLKGSIEIPIQMAILVPSTKEASEPISVKDFQDRIYDVEQFVSQLFGGFSGTSVEGGYYSEKHGVINESVKRVVFFSTEESFEKSFKPLTFKIKEWCDEWAQEYIGFELENNMYYISGFKLDAANRMFDDAEDSFSQFSNIDSALMQSTVAAEKEKFNSNETEMASGGALGDDNPKIYIADLAAYNEGKLIGEWIDLSSMDSGSEVMEAIQEFLDAQSEEQGVEREEYAIHDYENFPKKFYSESMGESDFDELIEFIKAAEDADIPMDVAEQWISDTGGDVSKLRDAFYGKYDDLSDFAEQYVGDVGGLDGVSNADQYISLSDTDRRIMAGEQADSAVDNMDNDDLVSRADMESDMESFKDTMDEIESAESELSDLKDELAALESDVESAESDLSDARDAENEDDIATYESQVEDATEKVTEKQEEIDEKETEIQNLRESLEYKDEDDIVDKARDVVRDEVYDEWYDGLGNAYSFLVEEQGIYDNESFLNTFKYSFDYDDFGEDLKQDYTIIDGEDGSIYVFTDNYAKGGKLPPKGIQQLIDKLNKYISLAVDSDGDAIQVVDKSGTWQSPAEYRRAYIDGRGSLKIQYIDYPNRLPVSTTDTIRKDDIESEGKPVLLQLIRMYKKALKDAGILLTDKQVAHVQPEWDEMQEFLFGKKALKKNEATPFAKGGKIKELSFDNSNLWLYGFGLDVNGNSVVKIGFPNRRAFSIQTNGVLNETQSILRSKKLHQLDSKDLEVIEREVVEYIKKHGSKEQKSVLHTYSKYKQNGING